jgi:hypothetical protein
MIWLVPAAGKRIRPTTPLMQPKRPFRCNTPGASTRTPRTLPARWMRNLMVTRPGT